MSIMHLCETASHKVSRMALNWDWDIFIDVHFVPRPLGLLCLSASSSIRRINHAAWLAAAIMAFS